MKLNRYLIAVIITLVSVVATPSFSAEGNEETSKQTFRLQYRTAGDALRPSGFFDVSGGNFSLKPFALKWRLPELSGEKKEAQQEQEKAFHNLIKTMERDGVNGLEFECTGQYENPSPYFISDLLVMSVPQLTKESKERLRRLADSPSGRHGESRWLIPR